MAKKKREKNHRLRAFMLIFTIVNIVILVFLFGPLRKQNIRVSYANIPAQGDTDIFEYTP